MMPPTVPRALRAGDTIAFVSPSSRVAGIFPDRVKRAQKFLENHGFRIRVIEGKLPEVFKTAVEVRAQELHEAFVDPSISAIVCNIGGLSANELLPILDYDLIRRNPKIFVGMSDITLLHHALYAGAGLRTFYGPCAITQWGELPTANHFTWSHFEQIVINNQWTGSIPQSPMYTDEFVDWGSSERPRIMQKAPGWTWLCHGAAEGVLWVSCLPSLLQLSGTQWEVDLTGKVLGLELPEGDGPGEPYNLALARSNLADLGMRGVWSKIKALVLGRPYRYTPEMCKLWHSVVLDLVGSYTSVPILADVDIGHTDPILTLPLGARCRVDSFTNTWELLEPSVLY